MQKKKEKKKREKENKPKINQNRLSNTEERMRGSKQVINTSIGLLWDRPEGQPVGFIPMYPKRQTSQGLSSLRCQCHPSTLYKRIKCPGKSDPYL